MLNLIKTGPILLEKSKKNRYTVVFIKKSDDPLISSNRSGFDLTLIGSYFVDPIGLRIMNFMIQFGSDLDPIHEYESDQIFCGTLIIK